MKSKAKQFTIRPGTVQRGTYQASGRTAQNVHHSVTTIFYKRWKKSDLVFA